jgi:hypothetical protein
MPLKQLATAGEILDANSTATIRMLSPHVLFSSSYPPDWSFRPLGTITISSINEVEPEERPTTETSTANRHVLLEEVAHIAQSPEAGIFIAARPVRKRLFEMQFMFPQGGLPKRKPFVWIPEGSGEE